MKRNRNTTLRRALIPLLLASASIVTGCILPHSRPAAAAPNPSTDPTAPPPLAWPAIDPIVASDQIGYLAGGGTVTGAGDYRYSMPLDVPDGRAGMKPSISLNYSSRGGNGVLGVGWSLDYGGSEISRCPKTMAVHGTTDSPNFLPTDALCLDGQPLVKITPGGEPMSDGAEYRTEKDTFAKIVAHGGTGLGPDTFEIFSKDGSIHTYTPRFAKRLPEPSAPPDDDDELPLFDALENLVIPVWVLSRTEDRSHNSISYHYEVISEDDAPYGFEYRIQSIKYTANDDLGKSARREVLFQYSDANERPDHPFYYSSGVRRTLSGRLKWIKLYAPNPVNSEYIGGYAIAYADQVDYGNDGPEDTDRSFVESINRYDRDNHRQWERRFEWQHATSDNPQFDVHDPPATNGSHNVPDPVLFDADNDGKDDLLLGERFCRTSAGSLIPFDLCLSGTGVVGDKDTRPADVDGNGKVDVLRPIPDSDDLAFSTWNATTSTFEPLSYIYPGAHTELIDADGDGLIDAFLALPSDDPNPTFVDPEWFYRRNNGNGFDPPEDFFPTMWATPGRPAAGMDLNGDGRGEIHVGFNPMDTPSNECAIADAQWRYHALGTRDTGIKTVFAATPQGSPCKRVFVDLNGDGLKDAFRANGLGHVRYNTGTGFLATESSVQATSDTILPSGPALTDIFPRYGRQTFQTVDIDGDGREDLISSNEATPSGDPMPNTYLYFSKESGLRLMNLGVAPYDIPSYDPEDVPVNLENHSPIIKPADVNGDGLVDLVVLFRDRQANTSSVRVLVQKWEPKDVIHRVWDETSEHPRETVFYSPFPTDNPSPSECAYPTRCVRHGMVTAREHWIHRQDQPQATRRTAYAFDDPRSDLRGRGFLGFRTVRTRDLDSYAETISVFDVAPDGVGRYPFAGLPRDVWTITPILPTATDALGGAVVPPAGLPVTARVTHARSGYESRPTNGGLTYAVFPARSRIDDWEQHITLDADGSVLLDDDSATTPRIREQSQVLDDYGNTLSAQAWTIGGQRCETLATYDNLIADWLLGLQLTTEVACGENGAPLPEPRLATTEYDTRGRVKNVTVEPNHPELMRETALTRDVYGLVTKVVASAPGELPRKSFVAYDEEHVYPRATWNALGHYSQQLVHPAYGVPVIGQNRNGVQVHYQHDGFGRVRAIDPDDGSAVFVSYLEDASDPWGLVVFEKSSDGGESTARFDEWGRTLATAYRGFDGQWIQDRIDYNRFGQATQLWRPAIGQAPSIETVTTFDTLGRTLKIVEPNGATTTTTHSITETMTIDAEGRQSRATRDVDDRLVATANLYEGQWVGMTYLYGDFSQVEDVVDPSGNVVHAIYDKLGRRLLQDDPDRGTASWSYNAYNEITSQVDPLGDTTVFERDLLGRVTWMAHDQDGVTTFIYDGQGNPGELGRLSSATSSDSVLTGYDYDAMGRNIKSTWQVGDDVYSVHHTYDGEGRLSTTEYPHAPGRAPLITEQSYNALGYADAVFDMTNVNAPKLLWSVTERNEEGLLKGSVSGNGFTETREFDPLTGQLSNIESVKSGTALFAIHYGRDLTGNILSRDDYAPDEPRLEAFVYDDLDRLHHWSVQHDQEVRITTYDYDLLGNMEKITRSSGVELHAHDGVMLGGGLHMPHALTGRTVGGQTVTYEHDAAGRQLTGDGRKIYWKSFDLPGEILQNGNRSTFSYDAFGSRVRKVRVTPGTSTPIVDTPVDEVDTIGGLYERRSKPNSPTEHVFYVQGTDGPVAQIVYTEGGIPLEDTLYLQGEALGSVGLVTDKSGKEVDRTYFDPFGAKVDADGVATSPMLGDVKLGFTGHRHDDELGLIDMKGRIYDPTQKRFLTPDPYVTDPMFGQSYNRYAYVLNNPLRYTDPTGFAQLDARSPMSDLPRSEPRWPRAKAAAGEINPVEAPPAGDSSQLAQPEASSEDGHSERGNGTTPEQDMPSGAEPQSTITITYEDGPSGPGGPTEASLNAARGANLGLQRTAAVEAAGREDLAGRRYRNSHRSKNARTEDGTLGEVAEWGAKAVLTAYGGESGALVGLVMFSGGGQMVSGMATGNGEDTGRGAKKLAIAVTTVVAIDVLTDALKNADPPRDLHAEAEAARDAMAADLKNQGHPPATVVGGYSASSGRVTAGASRGGGLGCAEGVCDGNLGHPGDMRFTTAVRPRSGLPIDVCPGCESKYGRGAFPSDAKFKSDRRSK